MRVGLLDIDYLDDDERMTRREIRSLARAVFNPRAAIREVYNAERRLRDKARTGHAVVVR